MKIAIITGGSRGLGRNTALALAARGIDSLMTYRSQAEEAAEVVAAIQAQGQKAAALRLDVGDASSFPAFAEQVRATLREVWGRDDFDILINNAGVGLHQPLLAVTEEQLDNLYNIHLKGPLLLTSRLQPLLKDGGRVVNLSSGLARFSMPGAGAYAAMKGAIEVLTRYQAVEWGARNIAVNVVAPGAIETDFSGGMVRDNPEVNRQVAANTALGRAGVPDDIGPAIAALVSDDCRWINGQRVEVSGGMRL